MSLQNLLKLQQQKKAAQNAEGGTDPANVRATESPERTAPGSDSDDSAAPVQVAAEALASDAGAGSDSREVPAGQSGGTAKAGGLGLRRLGQLGAVRRGAEQRADTERDRDVAGGRDSDSDGPAEFSLDDIAGLDESSAPALSRRETTGSDFLDEIEATAPDRELPAELTSQQLTFVEQLDGIYGVLSDPEMFAQSVRLVMMELQENKEYIKLVSDQDVSTMIRGMRNSMGLARVKKQEKSRKAGTGTKKGARKTSAETDNALALLNSLGLDDD